MTEPEFRKFRLSEVDRSKLPDGAREFLSQFKLGFTSEYFMEQLKSGNRVECRRMIEEANAQFKYLMANPQVYEWPTGEIVFDGNSIEVRLYPSIEAKTLVQRKRLRGLISSGMRRNLKKRRKGGNWEKHVDFTLDELIEHLESKFKPGMHWGNMGSWHIDHIIPVSAFNYSSPDDTEFKKCWSLKNLQPLWARENISKGAKYDPADLEAA